MKIFWDNLIYISEITALLMSQTSVQNNTNLCIHEFMQCSG